MSEPTFWQNREAAQSLSKKLNNLKSQVEFWEKLGQDVKLLSEMPDEKLYEDVKQRYEQSRITTFFSEQYDDRSAIVSIHSGAGGLDAQDWAAMLLRMYLMFCQNKGFKTELLEQNLGAEGGVKSATFEATGPYAYGYLKGEAGVHRLVRLSPFNPAHTRETSFALVEVLPVFETHEEIKLEPKDLNIETKTARGPGGQSVNTTYSAVRITHIPTGITVSMQSERSQHQNKERALKILKARLKLLEEQKQVEEKKRLRGEFKSAEWGNQIRSYVLHPYKLVKDHRTAYETADVDTVLNGNLDELVEKYLESLRSTK